MSRYHYELKLKIARENELGYGKVHLSKKYSINQSTIRNWSIQYKMYGAEGLKKSMTKTNYSGEFKLYVLKYGKIITYLTEKPQSILVSKTYLQFSIGIENMKKKDLNLFAVL